MSLTEPGRHFSQTFMPVATALPLGIRTVIINQEGPGIYSKAQQTRSYSRQAGPFAYTDWIKNKLQMLACQFFSFISMHSAENKLPCI